MLIGSVFFAFYKMLIGVIYMNFTNCVIVSGQKHSINKKKHKVDIKIKLIINIKIINQPPNIRYES